MTALGRRTAVALVAITLAVGGTGCSSDRSGVPVGDGATQAAPSSTGEPAGGAGSKIPPVRKEAPSWAKSALKVVPARVFDVSTVAQAVVPAVAVYPTATGGSPVTTLKAPAASAAPLVFLVQEQRGDRVRVLLPVRPNGSQGWVRAQDVKLSQHDYRIVVSVGAHTLTVHRGDSVIMTEKVGLGTSTTPTPGGVFYTVELLKPPDPKGAYGSYAYGLSGHSEVLNEFLGGDGQLGIHGTNDPSGLGKSVSHGCIRMRNAAIEKLAGMLPLGVPVQIVA